MALLEEERLSQQLVICGMHRSGTSLVASALQRAGLDIGRNVVSPGPGNLRGHFEDPDFHRLHEDMLAAAGETCFTIGNEFAPRDGAEFARRARALAAKREALPFWGWKDPRTCLFLELWEPILPQARYLFLYRHPVDVALSLWRRNTDPELRHDPWLAVRAWEIYNLRLLEFRCRHPGRTFLAQVPALTADFGSLIRHLRTGLELPLVDRSFASVFVPEELTPPTPEDPAWEKLIPGALALYRRLEENADLATQAAVPAAPRPAREHEHLRASESLLFALLETHGQGCPVPSPAISPGTQAHDRVAIGELEKALWHERRRAPEAAVHEQQSRIVLPADFDAKRRRSVRLTAELREERERSARAEARVAALAKVLAEIEGSRSFVPVRTWWRLRRWFARQRPTP